MTKVSKKLGEREKRRDRKMKRLALILMLALLLLAPSIFTMPRAEAAAQDYNYLLKIDRDLLKFISTGESSSVDAIAIASRSLDAVRRLVLSYGGTVRFALESINALAVTLPSTSVESIAKSSSIQKVWLDQEVNLVAQSDVSNMKADLIRSIVNKVGEKAANAEKTGEDKAILEGLDPELYAIPQDGILSLAREKEEISLMGIQIADVSPQTYFTYQVGAEALWSMGYTGAGTYVAVLDVGATGAHPMISSAIVGGHSDVPSEPNWDSASATHGTMTGSMAVGRPTIAVMSASDSLARAIGRWFPDKIIPAGTYPWGTIPAGYVGIAFIGEAPGAWLWVEKVLTYGGSGAISWILGGMQYVMNLRNTTPYHIDVVSMSLGLGQPWSAVNDGSDPWSLMVDVLVYNGIIVVQSSGNEGPGAFTIAQSAVAKKNIGVGGYVYARMMKAYVDWYYGYGSSDVYTHMGDDEEMVFYFASRGPTRDYRTGVAVVAPCAFTIGATGTSSLSWGSGTSFSAPRIAGEAALLIQYYLVHKGTYPTPETVKAAIAVGADFIPGYLKIEQGGGRWNPYKAAGEILKKNVVGQGNIILDVNNFHDLRVTGALTFTNGVSEQTVESLDIEHYSRFYFELKEPDMYRISITNIVEQYPGQTTIYMWIFDPKGDLANIGQAYTSGGTVLNYAQMGYYYYLVGETQYSGAYKWDQHWTPMDPGIWEIVVENDYFSREAVGYTIRVEKSEVSVSVSGDKVVLKNDGVDLGLTPQGGLKAYEGYTGSVTGNIKQGLVYATTFNVLPDTKELLVTLDWDDDYSSKYPADLDLYLIDPDGDMWVASDPPNTPMGIFGGTVNIPETDYFGDYTAGSLIAGTWTILVAGYKITPVTASENYVLSVEARIKDASKPTKVYDVESLAYDFELPDVAQSLFTGDDTYAAYTMPFSFPFYDGKDYNTIYVGSNGYITFTQGFTHYSDSNIWNMFLTTPTIAVMGRDLVTSAYAILHGNYVTILWYGRAFGAPPDHNLMLVQLYDNGDIVMSYNDWISGRAGVSKGDSATYITISPADTTAFKFTYSYTPVIINTYTYSMSTIPYFWETGGTQIFTGDDTYGSYTLPFSFPFYGTNYNTIYVGSNGYITFNQGYTYYSDSNIWNMFLTKPTICAMGRDLVTTGYAINQGTYVTIRWYGREYGGSTQRDLMEVQLYDNGNILISYSDWVSGRAGVSIGDTSNYITISPADTTAFQFTLEQTTMEYKLVDYTVTSEPFIWENIVMPIVTGDDAYATYTLPFSFPYCGSSYTMAYPCTNGYITFLQGYTSYSGIDGLYMSTPMVAVMGEDLISSVYAIDHGTYVTFLWIGRAYGEPTSSVRPLMQAKLHSDGAVELSYADWVSPDYWGRAAVAGISDGDGVNYQRISPAAETTWRITVVGIIPPAIEFAELNPWLPAGATVEAYYTENVAGNYIFVSKHYWVEKFLRDGGTYASVFGRFLYDNAEAHH
jgi:subtilisin family serine protease